MARTRSRVFDDEGLVERYLIDLSIESHEFGDRTFNVGDRVRAREDFDDDGISRGDEGVVVGFYRAPAAKETDRNYHFRKIMGTTHEQWFMFVEFDGCEPTDVLPAIMEPVR